jgi:AAA family ATP:ADP antiporter
LGPANIPAADWVRLAVLLLRRAADLHPGEGPRVLLAAAWFCCLLTTNYTLRPLRDAMGVAGGVEQLHWLFTATFLTMLAAVPAYGFAVARLGRWRLVPLVHRFFTLNLLLFFVLMQGWLDGLEGLGGSEVVRIWTARAFFVWTSVFNLFVISLFWSVMADLFSGADARRLFGLISLGGSVGAIAGPTIGGSLALWLDPGLLPLVSALLLELALWAMRAMQRAARTQAPSTSPDATRHDDAIGGSSLAAFAEISRSPTLLGICAYVLLLTMNSTALYFIQANIVASHFTDDGTRTAVFAGIDLSVNVLSVLTQGLLTGRLIRRLGLGWSLALLPVGCVIGFGVLAAMPVLAALLSFQIARRVADYAIARPAREVLYTAVDRSERYKAKSVIDTVVYRGGDALMGWVFAGLQALGLGLGGIALLSVPLAGLWALVGGWIGRRSEPGPSA